MKRPVLAIFILFSFGIVAARFAGIPFAAAAILSISFAVSALLISGHDRLCRIALSLALVFFGAAWYANSIILPSCHISRSAGDTPRNIIVKGLIADEPVSVRGDRGTYMTDLLLDARAVKDGPSWLSSRGLANVRVYSEKPLGLRYGTEIMLKGAIWRPSGLRNPGVFDYPAYLGMRNIYAAIRVRSDRSIAVVGEEVANPIRYAALAARGYIREALDTYTYEPLNGFLKSILIGGRSGLDSAIKDDFVKTGTVHVLAISGLQVGLIAAMLLFILRLAGMPKTPTLLLTSIALVFYAFVAGANPPIVRAVIMFIIFVAAYVARRDSDGLNTLALAAFLILLWNPKELFDPSFQLSFGSVASTIIFTPYIRTYLGVEGRRPGTLLGRARWYVAQAMAVSVAALIGIWPIVAYYFYIVTPVSIIANLVVIPYLSMMTAASCVLLCVGSISSLAAQVIAYGIDMAGQGLFGVNAFLARLPLAFVWVSAPSALFLIAYYTMVILRNRRVVIAALIVFNIIVWKEALSPYRDMLRVTFLDVGQGDSAFVEFPGGATMLIDAGSGGSEERFDAGRMAVAPFLRSRGITRIDAVVITHPHEDHLGGALYIVKNFIVGTIIDNGASGQAGEIEDGFDRAVRDKRIRRISAADGDTIEGLAGEGTKIFVMNPGRDGDPGSGNDGSIVLKITHDGVGILMCGDINSGAMARIVAAHPGLMRSDVVKIPHHGAGLGEGVTVEKFFSAVAPSYSIISVGRANRYNAPSRKTTDILARQNTHTYMTMDAGAVVLTIASGRYSCLPVRLK